MVSKPQIAFEIKAQADEKAQHTREYVSILKRSATQISDARWDFEPTSTEYLLPTASHRISAREARLSVRRFFAVVVLLK